MQKKLIFYIILIITILTAGFLSQWAPFSGFIGGFSAKGSGWLTSNLYSGISEIATMAQKRGEAIQDGIDQTKKIISDSVSKVENYFSGVTSSILGKENNANCPVQDPTAR